jgi:hypothetical protein
MDDELDLQIIITDTRSPYEGMSEQEILVAKDIAINEEHARELLNGAPPLILGFGESSDLSVDNSRLQALIAKNFPPEIMKFVRIGRVTKSDSFQVNFPPEISRDNIPEYLKWSDYGRVSIPVDKIDEFYIWVESQIHITKDDFYRKNTIFSSVPLYENIIKIELYNLGFKQNMQKSYFKDMPFFDSQFSDEQNLQMYTFALLGHEFTHRLQFFMPQMKELVTVWDEMMQRSEQSHITSYAKWYEDGTYNSNRAISVDEDMADSVMIYLMNPSYLPKDRYELISQHMPWLQPGSAQTVLGKS